MHNRLVIIGAGGHGKVIADIALKLGYSDIVFLDDNSTSECLGFPVIGDVSKISEIDKSVTDFIVAIGDNSTRESIVKEYNIKCITLIHPTAVIGQNVSIGEGTVIMANVVINPNSTIGKQCIINTGAVIEHDNILKNYVHISPRAILGGTVSIEQNTHIGIGAIIKNNITICSNCVIGAGATVVKNINISGTYIGLPAKFYK